MEATLSILVFKGDPIDAIEFRHTALFLEVPGFPTSLLHVTGGRGFFDFERQLGRAPEDSKLFIRKILVGTVVRQERATIEAIIMATSVRNADRSWNCQNWVGDALKKLSDYQVITREARTKAIDDMTEVVVEAPDAS